MRKINILLTNNFSHHHYDIIIIIKKINKRFNLKLNTIFILLNELANISDFFILLIIIKMLCAE